MLSRPGGAEQLTDSRDCGWIVHQTIVNIAQTDRRRHQAIDRHRLNIIIHVFEGPDE